MALPLTIYPRYAVVNLHLRQVQHGYGWRAVITIYSAFSASEPISLAVSVRRRIDTVLRIVSGLACMPFKYYWMDQDLKYEMTGQRD